MQVRTSISCLALAASLLSSCATSTNSVKLAAPDLQLIQTMGRPDLAYMRGPISLQYVLRVRNNSSEPITLRSLQLSTVGPGAYSLRTGHNPLRKEIPAGETAEIPISAWGYTGGGFLGSTAPVSIRGVARFDTPEGPMQKLFLQDLAQMGTSAGY
ncbi:MAG: hypothetical protein ABI718_12255 [Acidobacteriota bacterium]